ncbi:MAG: SDR family oxidoreductase [Verrucomicrobiota bacterium]
MPKKPNAFSSIGRSNMYGKPIAVLFGASGGIGSSLARSLSNEGWRLLLAGRSLDRLKAIEEADAELIQADATDPDDVANAFRHAREMEGYVAGAVNLLGNLLLKPAHRTSMEEWNDVLHVNLTSSFNVLKHAVSSLHEDGGSLVFMSSAAADVGLPNHEAIAAAKSGVEGLVRSGAASYAPKSIRINAVAPGLVRTPMTASITSSPPMLKASTAMHPLGRIGEPGDIASAITWLLNPNTRWVTGQVIRVDGGLSRIKPR